MASSSPSVTIKKETCPVCGFQDGDNGVQLDVHLISHTKESLVQTLLQLHKNPIRGPVSILPLPHPLDDGDEEEEEGEEIEEEDCDQQQSHVEIPIITTSAATTTTSSNKNNNSNNIILYDPIQSEFHHHPPPYPSNNNNHNHNTSSGTTTTTTTVQVVVLSSPGEANNDIIPTEAIHNPVSMYSDTGKNYNVQVIFTTNKGNNSSSGSNTNNTNNHNNNHGVSTDPLAHEKIQDPLSKKVSISRPGSTSSSNNNFNSPPKSSNVQDNNISEAHNKVNVIRDFTRSPTPNESTFTVLQPSPYYVRNEESPCPYILPDMSSVASHRIQNEFLQSSTPSDLAAPPSLAPPHSFHHNEPQSRVEATDEQEAINRSMYLSAIQLLSSGGAVPSSPLNEASEILTAVTSAANAAAVTTQRLAKAKLVGEVESDISNYLDVDLMTDEEMPGKGEISEFEESNTSFGSGDSNIRASVLDSSFKNLPCAGRPVSFSFGTDEEDTRNKNNSKSRPPTTPAIAEHSSSTAEKFICFDECQNHKSPKRFSSLFEMIQHKSGGHKKSQGSAFASILNNRLELEDPNIPRTGHLILDASGIEGGEGQEPASTPVSLQTRSYFCVYCEFTSRTKQLITEHVATEHPGRPINPEIFECFTCGKIFKNRSCLRKHFAIHREKAFVCTVCSKGFSSRFKLMEHTRVHTGFYPYKCSTCQKCYRTPSLLSTHEKQTHSETHVPKKVELMCGICHKVLRSKRNYYAHLLTHEQKPEKCVHCGETFARRAVLVLHMRASHDPNYTSGKTRDCTVCGKMLHPNSIRSHMLIHKQEKPHTCQVCHKKFRTLANLNNHAWSHTNLERPFKCKQCPKSYIFKKNLQNHIIVHKSRTLHFVCNECGVKFTNKRNLKRHVDEHTAEKKFKCLICGKKFFRHYYLIEHVRIHSGSRPFTCTICGKSSATKSNHAAHVKIHDARESGSLEN